MADKWEICKITIESNADLSGAHKLKKISSINLLHPDFSLNSSYTSAEDFCKSKSITVQTKKSGLFSSAEPYPEVISYLLSDGWEPWSDSSLHFDASGNTYTTLISFKRKIT